MKKIKANQPILSAESPRAARRRLDGLVAPPALTLPHKMQGEVFRRFAEQLARDHDERMRDKGHEREKSRLEAEKAPDFDHVAERRSQPKQEVACLPPRLSLALAFRRPVRV